MIQELGDASKHFLHPCTIFAHRDEHWVSTILGSCISVCLWDPKLCLGGINHYMLPLWNGEGLATPKYGNIAVEKLVEKMLTLGSRRDRMLAKIFGGAQIFRGEGAYLGVGDRNILVAQEILSRHRIQLVASDVGGSRGMKILFNTRTGSVLAARFGAEDPLARSLPDPRPEPPPRLKGRA